MDSPAEREGGVVAAQMGALLAERAAQGVLGRDDELDLLHRWTGPASQTLVVHVHGVAGIGKSALLAAFLTAERSRGTVVVRVDCRAVEPTERGFLHEVGAGSADVAEAARRLGGLGDRVLVALDDYEHFRLLDSWLRTTFVPALPENARVVLVGRDPPAPAWSTAPEWTGSSRSIALGPLPDSAALELLSRLGVAPAVGARLNRITRGHPLALRLAADGVGGRPDLSLEDAATQSVVAELTRLYLEDVRDPVTREALDAASVVRRTTQSLLRVMVPGIAPQDAVEKLRALPFVETGRDGLVLHQAVQQAISTTLRSADPERYRTLRRAAWRQLREEAADAGTPDHWRYTADSLYLIDNPVCREAFFPTGAQLLTVEPAEPRHEAAVQTLARRLEPPARAAELQAWWDETPGSFSVVLDRSGSVVGFYLMFEPGTVGRAALLADPVTAHWWRHLHEHPVPDGARVLFLRRWLGADGGEGPSPVQAACWLDVKRTYMALRPDLRRVYTGVRHLDAFAPVVTRLRFHPLDPDPVPTDDTVHSAVLTSGRRRWMAGWPTWQPTSWASTTPSPWTGTPARWWWTVGTSP